MLFTSGGKAIRFSEEEVRPMGRDATGVRGVKLGDGQSVISLIVVGEGHDPHGLRANGYGKLTPLEDFPLHGRGGQGVIALQTTERNGDMVAALQVAPGHELMLISSDRHAGAHAGRTMSPIVGRNTQGVRLIRLDEGERLTGVERVESLGTDDPDARGRPDGVSEVRSGRRTDFGSRAGSRDLQADGLVATFPLATSGYTACASSISPRVRRHCRWKSSSRCSDELTDWHGSGMSVMEISHRGKAFIAVRRAGRGRPARAAGDSGELQGAVPAGRRQRPVRARFR